MSLIESINAELLALPDRASPADRLGPVFRAYSDATGVSLPADPSLEQRKVVEDWLRMQRDDAIVSLGVTRRKGFRFLVNLTTSEKAGRLAQLACPTCGPAQRSFPVDVDPWSAQAQSKLKVEIREGVTKQLANGSAQSGTLPMIPVDPVCISIVAVVPVTKGGRGRKDADNLAKGLLDAMAGIIYSDDQQVQCLTVRRLDYSGEHGHYMVGVRRSEPFSADVIYEGPEGADIRWAAREKPV